jgi:glycosyltransferase involved in cell wall biosynthesis
LKFSVLIAAYQAGRFLPSALASLRAQEHQDWELVVVEDGSHDGTEEIVRAFADGESRRVQYENLGTNRGVAAARNRLLELAQGEGLAFLDADDRWTPRHLLRARETLEAGADLVVARLQTFDLASGRELETYVPPAGFFADPVRGLFERSAIMTSSCVALRRSLAEKAGRFDEAFCVGEDRDYWLRCALLGARLAETGEVTCHYAKHTASAMTRTLVWAQQEVAFFEKHQLLAAVPVTLRRALLTAALLNHGRLLRATDPRRSAQILWRAWKTSPARLAVLPHLVYSVLSAFRPRSVGPGWHRKYDHR